MDPAAPGRESPAPFVLVREPLELPRRLQWWLKRRGMPVIYWELMLKGREWYAGPGSLERVRAGA